MKRSSQLSAIASLFIVFMLLVGATQAQDLRSFSEQRRAGRLGLTSVKQSSSANLHAAAPIVVLTTDGRHLPAHVVREDATNDMALLKVDASSPSYLALSSSAPELGQTAIAIGNALGEYRNTVSVGVVSGLERSVRASIESTLQ